MSDWHLPERDVFNAGISSIQSYTNNNLLTKVIMLLGVSVQSVVIIQINHLKTKTEKESKYFLRASVKCNGEFLRNGFITFRECLVVFVHNQ